MGGAAKSSVGLIRLQTFAMVLILALAGSIIMDEDADTDGLLTISGGPITEDTTWRLVDSPINIQGNISVAAGVTLTIEAGVIVRLVDDVYFEVLGGLHAAGTESQPIYFTKSEDGGFDRINISDGGYAMMDHCLITVNYGVGAMGTGSRLMIYNSTVSATNGVFAFSGAEVWMIDTQTSYFMNVTVSGGTIHEGNWFFFRSVKDIDGSPYQGAELKMSATQPQGSDWTIYDSGAGDPKTGSNGTIAPIAAEQYLHALSRSNRRVMITLKLNAENSRWTKTVDNPPIYMGANINYTWELDFTPPPPPSNLTVIEKDGDSIRVGWDYDHDQSQIAYFIIEYKKFWEADTEWDRLEPSPSARDQQITDENPPNPNGGLLEEMEYDIRISCIDGSDNPSTKVGPITVKTLDVTPPAPARDVKIIDIGGHYAHIQWNRSVSLDVINYEIYLNGTDIEGQPDIIVPSEDIQTQTYNLSGIMNETQYSVILRAMDDGEIPNFSNTTEPASFKTLDISPPVQPTLELQFIDPPKFKEDTYLYNGTQVALTGHVEGENRTFIEVYVNDQLYIHPNPDLPKPASFMGNFFFFIILEDGDFNIKVRSIDASHNIGPFSQEKFIRIDRKAPMIGVDIEGFEVEVDANIEIQFLSNASDENGVHTVNWTLNGPEGKVIVLQENLLYDFEVGNYTVTVHAQDNAGNVNSTTFKVVSLVPDNNAPTASVTEPDTNIDLDHAPIFKVRFSEPVVWNKLDAYVIGEDEGAQRITLLKEIDRENLSITYQLTSSLEGGNNYSFVIEGIEDLRGNAGNDLNFEFKTIPDDRIDSDGDGIPDYYEVQRQFLNPSNPNDAGLDQDEDGVTNLQEYLDGTDPDLPDSDGDQMTDDWEKLYGLDPTDNRDALTDLDGDGYTNLEEFRADTDPTDENDKPEGGSGSDPTLWILLAAGVFVIAVIAGIVLLVIKKRGDETEKEEGEEEVREEDTSQTWSEQEEAKKGECPSCGATLEEGMDYCPECGFSIPEDEVGSGELSTDEEPPLEDESIMDEEEEAPSKENGIPSQDEDSLPDPEDITLEEDMELPEPPKL